MAYIKQHPKLFLWAIAIVLGALETWVNRHAMNPDGVSYLDIGDAYFRGDWDTAINATWSPLYSWLLGAAMFLVNPAPEREYPLAHLVNFFIYLAALVCFDFFLGELIRGQKARPNSDPGESSDPLPWVLLLTGYLIFIWASLVLIPSFYIVPDMCVAALVYLAAGLLLRIRRTAQMRLFALLGIVLGFSYLAKAAMFPVSILLILVSAALVGSFRQAWPRLWVALGCYALVAAPFVLVLSQSKGRLTFGDSGKLNYAWLVNDVPTRHWQGGDGNQGIPVHPTRRVLESPAIYEFGTPIQATYAVWYDPSYWYEGVRIHFNLQSQLLVVANHIRGYLSLYFFQGVVFIIGLLLLFLLRRDRRLLAEGVLRQWFLLLPACAAIAMYSLVHVENRYLAPFVVLILMGVISGIRRHTDPRGTTLTTLVLFVILLVTIGPSVFRLSSASSHRIVRNNDAEDVYLHIAESLKRMGVRQGDKVASLGYANPRNAGWARLAKVRIVAEMYDSKDVNSFWTGDAALRRDVMDAFWQTGTTLIVAANVPRMVSTDGWQQLEGTDTYVYFLPKDRPFVR